ncbi:efflux transporter, HAE1 family, inner membrane component [Myxococcus xanthus DK 1622]|uniref:Efflux transporter, HAE1 family, inner membrane component n=1 Tax=Myxococcus xanthus (strain DK1622) TaxID=246197 RepID=Q1CW70_MYXXD|nr:MULTISPECIES: multidrug efflux RND transporter permease subunit [Myxococcus]ABF91182.1 efflux transporter, HAE1 family, inner membrane component [Myxococcus xanthus DK 1622]NOJ51690.1 multidrug efflux RND transporter permease subunit [Myxococcus xanthus]QPM79493.1 multidrug efflux RND transporter permease subunit [Myxococcus xanthus]QVW68573.1 multidrug efflux RND transporter permease subunit [Myxococcus xanthus DZ2]QZZ54840.1 Efflux pump membrane transporter BepE [Myxococcus xanthus]
MFTDFFIRRPVFASVVSIIITLVGAISIPILPIEQYPDLSLPVVQVTATYIGASAETVESAVTTVLERQLNGVEGMRYISSTSSNTGVSTITVTFDPGRDLDIAAVDVQNRVATASAQLPAAVNALGVTITKAQTQLLMAFGLFDEENRYETGFLSNYADVFIRDALLRVTGVGDVRIFGERRFAMRLWLDPSELARRGLAATDVVNALRAQNVQIGAGQVGQPPAPPGQTYQFTVRVLGQLTSAEEFGNIVVQQGPDGSLVRLKDVGRAELGAENYGQLLRFNGREAVGLGIFQLPGSNALDVRDGIVAELKRLKGNFPPGMRYQRAFDTTAAVQASIEEVLVTLGEAIFLVVLVIFIFLHGWRSVLVVATTLPVSLVGTFLFVNAFGFSINTLTLFGLTLATGLVVDDAIIVIENVERTMEQDDVGPREATHRGMKQVAGALVAIALVLSAVFVPVSFFPGTTGIIYRQFALTLAFSISLSALVALTLSPALCAILLRPHEGQKWKVFRMFDRGLDAFRDAYGRMLAKLIGPLRWPVVIAFVVCLAGTILVYRLTPTGFIPGEDQGYLIIAVQGPEGTSLDYTRNVLLQAEDVLRQQPEVADIFTVGGFSLLGTGVNYGTLFVNLHPWDERKRPDQSVAGLVERLRHPLMAIGGARVLPFEPPAIRGVGSVGGFEFVLEDQQGGRTLAQLAQTTDMLVGAASQDPGLRGVFSSYTANTPLLDVQVDREKALAMGVPLDGVFSTLQVYLGSQYVNDFTFASRVYRVYVQAAVPFRNEPRDIDALYVRSAKGEMVPLESLVQVRPITSAQNIQHYNLYRSATINGQAAPGSSSGQALDTMEAVARKTLPVGYTFEWTGLSQEQKEAGRSVLLIFGLGVVFVFLVLSAQYESFALPLVILLGVPVAMLGALGLQNLRGLQNDVFCQVGLVMLVGLASKNAILIVEFAEQLRHEGRSVEDAAIHAAQTRLRPILMTSFAFLMGVVPLMLASGAGASARKSLGTTVFGGMLLSTFVNLIFIPVLYVVLEAARLRVRPPKPHAP